MWEDINFPPHILMESNQNLIEDLVRNETDKYY